MKYEINTPYEFEVKEVTNQNDTLAFQVEISGNLFPVQAYSEQLEEITPKNISCRIMLDQNKNAYLVQNEAFLYPYLYKSGKRYIFEIVDIRDSYVVVQDKHGLLHAMPKDGTKLSINEIIVRCVKIINDANSKAHLQFTYVEPSMVEPKKKHIDNTKKVLETVVVPQYAPTVFEEDAPKETYKNIGLSTSEQTGDGKKTKSAAISIKPIQANAAKTVTSLILSRDWDSLKSYLDANFDKAKVVSIQKEIAETILQFTTGTQYWETISFLIKYDARKFLATLAKIDVSHLSDISNSIDSGTLDKIVTDAFIATDKLKYAVNIISPCAAHLTLKQKNYIQSKCVEINTPDTFYSLFKVLRLSPDDAIVYLLSIKDNIAAAFTIYKFYLDGKKGNRLKETSRFVAFRPSVIAKYIELMVQMQSYPFTVSAKLIKCNILSKEYCPISLQNEVRDSGFEGFLKYIRKSQQEKEHKKNLQLLADLAVGDMLFNLSYLKDTDYYHVLYNNQIGVYALLDKKLTDTLPNKSIKSQGKIVKILTRKNRKYFIIAQKKKPSMYIFPPLVDNSTILRISFSKGSDVEYIPKVKNCFNLITAEVESYPPSFDYKLKYEAKIVRKVDFFTYIVKIINPK